MEENRNRSEGALSPSEVLAEQIEKAFHYRGDVTLRLSGERSLSGYLFNRSGNGEDASVQVMLPDGQGSVSIPYREIQEIVFSGADAADGKSFEAWKAKKNGERQKEAEQIATDMRRQGLL
ncbi:hypothetical protein [Methylacidimicrobium tartarophylax]|uniref:Uncharacterized protein n=1 Tax=Methylacidimicrobium tartarophylax TaxID=1041768 RepID=A0A5E6MEN9_9BACT|nr:hypothetical protein [Methylacidimicrobium tartarophylax]VVM06293.1 hypothetical protein MAMT_01112 [Methylacidimicrobium tartarophylax]